VFHVETEKSAPEEVKAACTTKVPLGSCLLLRRSGSFSTMLGEFLFRHKEHVIDLSANLIRVVGVHYGVIAEDVPKLIYTP
jgi:hypothetical protein